MALQRLLSRVEPEIVRQISAYAILKCSRWLPSRCSRRNGHYRPGRTARHSAPASWRAAPGWSSFPDRKDSETQHRGDPSVVLEQAVKRCRGFRAATHVNLAGSAGLIVKPDVARQQMAAETATTRNTYLCWCNPYTTINIR
jgi:hypothetical protein